MSDHRTDRNGFALLDHDLAQGTRLVGGDLYVRLVGLDLGDRLAGLHLIALMFKPDVDRPLFHSVAHFGHADLSHNSLSLYANARFTAAITSLSVGMAARSRFLA